MDPFADNSSQSGYNVQTLEPPEPHQNGQNVVLSEGMKASKLFHGLQPQEVAEIAARLQPVSCKRGERIIEQGIRHGRLYIIASGQVSVLLQDGAPGEGTTSATPGGQTWPGQNTGGREHSGAQSHIITQLGPGECFGEMELITGVPPSATVRAERDTVLWSLTHPDFIALSSACPTLLSNINAILAQRLAHMNQRIGSTDTAETTWLALIENPGAPLEHSLAFHIADALAARSRKRVLLIDMGEQDALLAPHFATHKAQMRPSLLECARDAGSLRKHQAPMVTAEGRHYPAITTLLPTSTRQATFGVSESGDFDISSILRDLSGFYDYLLLVTTGTTPPTVMEMAARNCSRAVLLISSDTAALPLASGSEVFSVPHSIFIAHVPEHPTIGAQDRYAKRLGRSVTRLLPADTSLLEESWKRRVALSETAPHSVLTQAVDFVARHIAHLTVGIAFGGGGARGFAHLGAFERLLHYGIPVDYLAGCSIGILPPSLYLMGKSFAESEELFLDIHRHIMHLGLPRMSIFSKLTRVWSVLVDLEHYSEWNTFVPSMHSSFQVGSLLTMRVRLRKWLYVKSVETITAIAPQHLLAWKTRSPDWFLQGERFQVLTMIDTNTTQYWTRESFSGIFAPVLKILLARDLQHGFDAVAQNLKARIESNHHKHEKPL